MFNLPTDRFPWDDLRKSLPRCQQMASVLNGAERLSRVHERYRQSDRRQTNGRQHIIANVNHNHKNNTSVNSPEFQAEFQKFPGIPAGNSAHKNSQKFVGTRGRTTGTLSITRNSPGDEIANVNFLYDDIVHVLQNTINSCINSATDRRGGYVLKLMCLPNSVK